MKILVTDGLLKCALAAVRTLGRAGVEVHVTQESTKRTICSLSRYTSQVHVLPPPTEGARFDEALLDLLRRERFDRLFPSGELTTHRVVLRADEVRSLVRADLPPPEALELVLSKTGLFEAARAAGVRLPLTAVVGEGDDPRDRARAIGYPLVAKSAGGSPYDRVRHIGTPEELSRFCEAHRGSAAILLQQRVPGEGCGVFALFRGGEPVAVHTHRRIWEYPPTGGPSVMAETTDDPALQALGVSLLKQLEWNGLAMVEFKRDADGTPLLMEINPRPWGSLDLSIAAGVDFPRIAAGLAPPPLAVSPTRFLWLAPDGILFLIARPSALPSFVRQWASPGVHTNLCRDDLRPFLLQVRTAAYWVKHLGRRVRHPHGRFAS